MPFGQQAEDTVATNYFGTRHLCEALFPLLRRGARVVNVSSRIGLLSFVANGSQLRQRLANDDLSLEELDGWGD